MKNPTGSAIRVDGYGDGIEGTMYMSDLNGQNYQDIKSLTLEVLIYPEKILPIGEETHTLIKSEQSYPNELQILRYSWISHLWVKFGKENFGDDGKVDEALSEHQWHYVKMKLERDRLYLYVDGKEIYNEERAEPVDTLFDFREVNIYLGDFIGWIDEFKVSIEMD